MPEHWKNYQKQRSKHQTSTKTKKVQRVQLFGITPNSVIDFRGMVVNWVYHWSSWVVFFICLGFNVKLQPVF